MSGATPSAQGTNGGGFLLFVAPNEKRTGISNALGLREEPLKLDPLGSRIINMEGLM